MGGPTNYRDAQAFQQWIDQHNLQPSDDYDLKSAFQSGLEPDARGHLPDTYKLPNHITYSNESLYSQLPDAPPAGAWTGEDGNWKFEASPQNVKNAGGAQKLVDYFHKYEPGTPVVLPNGRTFTDGRPH